MRRRETLLVIRLAALAVLRAVSGAAAQPPPPPPAAEPAAKPSPQTQPNPTPPAAPPALAEQRARTTPADAPAVPDWVRDVTWYYIDVPRFRNGSKDNDPPDTRPWIQPLVAPDAWEATFDTTGVPYGGDLQGVKEKLSYIKELGFGAICLSRVFDPPTEDGVTDSTRWAIRPDVSTTPGEGAAPDADLTPGDLMLLDLVRACREQGLRLVVEVPVRLRTPGADAVAASGVVTDISTQVKRWLAPSRGDVMIDGLDGVLLRVLDRIETTENLVLTQAARNSAPDAVLIVSSASPVFPTQSVVLIRDTREASVVSCFSVSATNRGVPLGEALRRIEAEARSAAESRSHVVQSFSSPAFGRAASLVRGDSPGASDGATAREVRLKELRAWRLALTVNMCLPHSVMLMYGDEVGMTGAHGAAALAPMWWVEPGPKEAPSADYRADFRALVRLMNDLRARYEPLRRGDFKLVLADDERRVSAFSRTSAGRTVIVVVNASDDRREVVLEPGLVEGDMVAVIRPELEPLIPRSQQPGIDPLRSVLVEPKLRLAGNRTLADAAGRISINLDPMSVKLVLTGPDWTE
ncbi:MAG: hypothetical protein BroJett003_00170 [Planctomycetota bacterium]|nr:MAG: hypothetical protein BroJett003_00170 [Planctomycetota bacterium]